jgi:hypothetical protein
MGQPVTEDEFLAMVRGFRRSAFRLETLGTYAPAYEREEFKRFLAGAPRPPSEVDWWRPWLDRVARMAQEGRTISRVRVLNDPPGDYERWQLWAAPWHVQAGEDIRYLPRGRATEIGLPLGQDWWLLDDEKLLLMEFTADGDIGPKTLVTDVDAIARYRAWRDLAMHNAAPAEAIRAA